MLSTIHIRQVELRIGQLQVIPSWGTTLTVTGNKCKVYKTLWVFITQML